MEPASVPPPAISPSKWGWKIRANIPAIAAERKRVTIDGTFFAINTPVATGTSRSQSEMSNVPFSDSA